MKNILILFILLVSSLKNFSQTTASNFNKLEWLIGDWERTNAKPGRSGTEKWIKNSSDELQGRGIYLKGNDTVLIEKLKLVIKDNNIYYVADLVENKQPVFFKVTLLTDTEFVCENPEHDFPKMIVYKHEGNKIKAIISGNGKSIEYLFDKK